MGEVGGCLMYPMTESGLEDIIKDLCKMMVIVNMFHKGIVLEELHYNQHRFRQDNNNNNNTVIISIHINNNSNSSNSFNNSNISNNFNLLHILINILLILVQLLEHPQRAPRTKTSVSFHDKPNNVYLHK